MKLGSTTLKCPADDILPEILVEPDKVTDGYVVKPLTDSDADMRTLDELRGISKKVDDLRGIAGSMKAGYKNLHEAKLSLNEKATVQGCMVEMDVMRQKMAMQGEQMNRLIGMYQTLAGEFKQYREQRVRELNVRVGGMSTSAEDYDDGPNA